MTNNIEILSETGVKLRNLETGGMFRFVEGEYVYMRLRDDDAVSFARLDDGTLFRHPNGTVTAEERLDEEVTPVRSITIS